MAFEMLEPPSLKNKPILSLQEKQKQIIYKVMIASVKKPLIFNHLCWNLTVLQSGRRAYFFFLKMIYGEVIQAKEITGHKKN